VRFRPSGQEDLAPSGVVSRLRANIAALRTLRAIQADGNRPATPEEQAVMARWSGWGAVPAVWDEGAAQYEALQWARDELAELLDAGELAAARRNTLNAHYTDAGLVQAMWQALRDLGFEGGRVLEPGCGAGNFIAFAPDEAEVVGVELDPTTAAIAAAVHPHATVLAESFADTRIPDGSFDVAIGNVPFANVVLHDRRHNQGGHSIHNHFILKSLAATKPGGLVAVITSAWTMDTMSPAARREMATLGDLVGAVRLPNGAHRRAAGTDALTDVLLFRRREADREPDGMAWERTRPVEINGETIRVNEYFVDHPENVLGDLGVDHGPYHSAEVVVRGNRDAPGLTAALDRIITQARENGLTFDSTPPEPTARRAALVPTADREPDGYLQANADGSFTQVVDGITQPYQPPKTQAAELRALLGIRDAVRALLKAEAASLDDTDDIDRLRAQLNQRYDAYAARYGPVNRSSERRTGRVDPKTGKPAMARVRPPQGGFRDDPYANLVYALEHFDETRQVATKADIFAQRVVSVRVPRLGADTPADALAICLDTYGVARLDKIAELLGMDEPEARKALGTLAFDEPDTGRLVPAPEYLSGNVRLKLDHARATAAEDPDRYQVNVDALTKVIPRDLTPSEITAQLGASWIDKSYVRQFLRELLEDPRLEVEHPYASVWSVTSTQRYSVLNTTQWGTERYPATDLAEALLQQRQIRVTDEDARGRRSLNPEASVAAQEKAAEMAERFSEWVWEDPQRASELARHYNRQFNSTALRSYDNVELSLPGLAKTFTPRPHQVAAVARIIAEPSVGLFHEVGAGKTAEMVIAAMELRRLGFAKKPVIVVPNHMLVQFTTEFLQLYPQAKLLAASTADLKKDKRRRFQARCATGDWDAVIMTRTAFERIPMSREVQQEYLEREIQELEEAVQRAEESGERRSLKRLEGMLLRAEERVKKLLDSVKDPGLTFENTGIDYIFADEAHAYKNLRTPSNIPNLSVDGSNRATDLDMKLHYLRTRYDRVATLATATPIANSMGETYVMLKYLRPDLLADLGIANFDTFASTFGRMVTGIEVAPEGGLRVNTRFAKFVNVPELLRPWNIAGDIKTAEDLKLPVPLLAQREDGQRLPETVIVPPSEELKAFIAELGQRADDVRSGRVDAETDNMLKITTQGKAAASDLRLVGRSSSEPGKIEVAADTIASIYRDTADRVYPGPDGEPHPAPGALQLVFADLGTPHPYRWNVYDALRAELAARGVPREKIRFIHEARNDKEKAELFAACRDGRIAVLIGSTEKMGVGTNVQKRAVALHHLDCPWRPADLQQREGRILRQGNLNPEVRVIRYVTEGSFDGYSWQTVSRKAEFIAQVMRGRLDIREIEDIGDSALSYNEVKALATGNPLLLDHAQAEAEVIRLERSERAHSRSQDSLQWVIRDANGRIEDLTQRITQIDAAIARRVDVSGDKFTMTVDGRQHTKRSEANQHLQAVLAARLDSPGTPLDTTFEVGEYAGFTVIAEIYLDVQGTRKIRLELPDVPASSFRLTRAEVNGADLITRLGNRLAALEELRANHYTPAIESHREEKARAERQFGQPFQHAEALAAARTRLAEITTQLEEIATPTQPPPQSPPPPPSLDAATPVTPHDADVDDDRRLTAAAHDTAAMAEQPPGQVTVYNDPASFLSAVEEAEARRVDEAQHNRSVLSDVPESGSAAGNRTEVTRPERLERAHAAAQEVTRLERLEHADPRDLIALRADMENSSLEIERLTKRLVATEAAIERRVDMSGDAFTMTVDGRSYTERSGANEHLGAVLAVRLDDLRLPLDTPIEIGSYAGFDLTAEVFQDEDGTRKLRLQLVDVPAASIALTRTEVTGGDLVSWLDGRLAALEKLHDDDVSEIQSHHENFVQAKEKLAEPAFRNAQALAGAQMELDRISLHLPSPPGRAAAAESPWSTGEDESLAASVTQDVAQSPREATVHNNAADSLANEQAEPRRAEMDEITEPDSPGQRVSEPDRDGTLYESTIREGFIAAPNPLPTSPQGREDEVDETPPEPVWVELEADGGVLVRGTTEEDTVAHGALTGSGFWFSRRSNAWYPRSRNPEVRRGNVEQFVARMRQAGRTVPVRGDGVTDLSSPQVVDALAPFAAVDRVRIELVVRDHAYEYVHAGTAERPIADIAQAITEAHLQALVDVYGGAATQSTDGGPDHVYGNVDSAAHAIQAAVAHTISTNPEVLSYDEAQVKEHQQARRARFDAAIMEAITARDAGEVEEALQCLTAAELIEPDHLAGQDTTWQQVRNEFSTTAWEARNAFPPVYRSPQPATPTPAAGPVPASAPAPAADVLVPVDVTDWYRRLDPAIRDRWDQDRDPAWLGRELAHLATDPQVQLYVRATPADQFERLFAPELETRLASVFSSSQRPALLHAWFDDDEFRESLAAFAAAAVHERVRASTPPGPVDAAQVTEQAVDAAHLIRAVFPDARTIAFTLTEHRADLTGVIDSRGERLWPVLGQRTVLDLDGVEHLLREAYLVPDVARHLGLGQYIVDLDHVLEGAPGEPPPAVPVSATTVTPTPTPAAGPVPASAPAPAADVLVPVDVTDWYRRLDPAIRDRWDQDRDPAWLGRELAHLATDPQVQRSAQANALDNFRLVFAKILTDHLMDMFDALPRRRPVFLHDYLDNNEFRESLTTFATAAVYERVRAGTPPGRDDPGTPTAEPEEPAPTPGPAGGADQHPTTDSPAAASTVDAESHDPHISHAPASTEPPAVPSPATPTPTAAGPAPASDPAPAADDDLVPVDVTEWYRSLDPAIRDRWDEDRDLTWLGRELADLAANSRVQLYVRVTPPDQFESDFAPELRNRFVSAFYPPSQRPAFLNAWFDDYEFKKSLVAFAAAAVYERVRASAPPPEVDAAQVTAQAVDAARLIRAVFPDARNIAFALNEDGTTTLVRVVDPRGEQLWPFRDQRHVLDSDAVERLLEQAYLVPDVARHLGLAHYIVNLDHVLEGAPSAADPVSVTAAATPTQRLGDVVPAVVGDPELDPGFDRDQPRSIAPDIPQGQSSPDPGPLRVEVNGNSVLVRGTSKEDLAIREILGDHGFNWSKRLEAWWLPRNLRATTRQRKIKEFLDGMERAGRERPPVIDTSTAAAEIPATETTTTTPQLTTASPATDEPPEVPRGTNWGPKHFAVGDLVRIGRSWHQVEWVNPKSLRVPTSARNRVSWDLVSGWRRGPWQRYRPNEDPWPVHLTDKVERWHAYLNGIQNFVHTARREREDRALMAMRLVLGVPLDTPYNDFRALVTQGGTSQIRAREAQFADVLDRLVAGETPEDIRRTPQSSPGVAVTVDPPDREQPSTADLQTSDDAEVDGGHTADTGADPQTSSPATVDSDAGTQPAAPPVQPDARAVQTEEDDARSPADPPPQTPAAADDAPAASDPATEPGTPGDLEPRSTGDAAGPDTPGTATGREAEQEAARDAEEPPSAWGPLEPLQGSLVAVAQEGASAARARLAARGVSEQIPDLSHRGERRFPHASSVQVVVRRSVDRWADHRQPSWIIRYVLDDQTREWLTGIIRAISEHPAVVDLAARGAGQPSFMELRTLVGDLLAASWQPGDSDGLDRLFGVYLADPARWDYLSAFVGDAVGDLTRVVDLAEALAADELTVGDPGRFLAAVRVVGRSLPETDLDFSEINRRTAVLMQRASEAVEHGTAHQAQTATLDLLRLVARPSHLFEVDLDRIGTGDFLLVEGTLPGSQTNHVAMGTIREVTSAFWDDQWGLQVRMDPIPGGGPPQDLLVTLDDLVLRLPAPEPARERPAWLDQSERAAVEPHEPVFPADTTLAELARRLVVSYLPAHTPDADQQVDASGPASEKQAADLPEQLSGAADPVPDLASGIDVSGGAGPAVDPISPDPEDEPTDPEPEQLEPAQPVTAAETVAVAADAAPDPAPQREPPAVDATPDPTGETPSEEASGNNLPPGTSDGPANPERQDPAGQMPATPEPPATGVPAGTGGDPARPVAPGDVAPVVWAARMVRAAIPDAARLTFQFTGVGAVLREVRNGEGHVRWTTTPRIGKSPGPRLNRDQVHAYLDRAYLDGDLVEAVGYHRYAVDIERAVAAPVPDPGEWGPGNVQVGDLVYVVSPGRDPERVERGQWWEVTRLNQKSVAVRNESGAKATVRLDRVGGLRRHGEHYDTPASQPLPADVVDKANQWRQLSLDERRSGSRGRRDVQEWWAQIRQARQLVLGLPDGEVSAAEVAAYPDLPDAATRLGLLARHVDVVARLTAGEPVEDIRASLPAYPASPVWRFPTDVEPVTRAAGDLEPGDLVRGAWKPGRDGLVLDMYLGGHVVEVKHLGRGVGGLAEMVGWVEVTTAEDGTTHTLPADRRFAVYPAGTTASHDTTAAVPAQREEPGPGPRAVPAAGESGRDAGATDAADSDKSGKAGEGTVTQTAAAGDLVPGDTTSEFPLTPTWGPEHFRVGDFVRVQMGGRWNKVTRVNRKTLRVVDDPNREGWLHEYPWVYGWRRGNLYRERPDEAPWSIELAEKVEWWKGYWNRRSRIQQVRQTVHLVLGIPLEGTDGEVKLAALTLLQAAHADERRTLMIRCADVAQRLEAGEDPAAIRATLTAQAPTAIQNAATGVESSEQSVSTSHRAETQPATDNTPAITAPEISAARRSGPQPEQPETPAEPVEPAAATAPETGSTPVAGHSVSAADVVAVDYLPDPTQRERLLRDVGDAAFLYEVVEAGEAARLFREAYPGAAWVTVSMDGDAAAVVESVRDRRGGPLSTDADTSAAVEHLRRALTAADWATAGAGHPYRFDIDIALRARDVVVDAGGWQRVPALLREAREAVSRYGTLQAAEACRLIREAVPDAVAVEFVMRPPAGAVLRYVKDDKGTPLRQWRADGSMVRRGPSAEPELDQRDAIQQLLYWAIRHGPDHLYADRHEDLTGVSYVFDIDEVFDVGGRAVTEHEHFLATRDTAAAPGGDPLARFTLLERAVIEEAVRDHAAGYYRMPGSGLSRYNAVRYVTEGHLKQLDHPFAEVWAAVEAVINSDPAVLDRTEQDSAADRQQREETAERLVQHESLAAFEAGRYGRARRLLDQAQLLAPSYIARRRGWHTAQAVISERRASAVAQAVLPGEDPLDLARIRDAVADHAHRYAAFDRPAGDVARLVTAVHLGDLAGEYGEDVVAAVAAARIEADPEVLTREPWEATAIRDERARKARLTLRAARTAARNGERGEAERLFGEAQLTDPEFPGRVTSTWDDLQRRVYSGASQGPAGTADTAGQPAASALPGQTGAAQDAGTSRAAPHDDGPRTGDGGEPSPAPDPQPEPAAGVESVTDPGVDVSSVTRTPVPQLVAVPAEQPAGVVAVGTAPAPPRAENAPEEALRDAVPTVAPERAELTDPSDSPDLSPPAVDQRRAATGDRGRVSPAEVEEMARRSFAAFTAGRFGRARRIIDAAEQAAPSGYLVAGRRSWDSIRDLIAARETHIAARRELPGRDPVDLAWIRVAVGVHAHAHAMSGRPVVDVARAVTGEPVLEQVVGEYGAAVVTAVVAAGIDADPTVLSGPDPEVRRTEANRLGRLAVAAGNSRDFRLALRLLTTAAEICPGLAEERGNTWQEVIAPIAALAARDTPTGGDRAARRGGTTTPGRGPTRPTDPPQHRRDLER
jgi:N12 class adenine-specific DNA methylase/SAM-dependent methyltransferase